MMLKVRIKYLVFVILLLVGLISCENGFKLKNIDNQSIPNYSNSIASTALSPNMQSNTIALTDDMLLTAIETESHRIEIMTIGQAFVNDNWQLTGKVETSLADGNLLFFDSLGGDYILGYNDLMGRFVMNVLDQNYGITKVSPDYKLFVDTFYNGIDSFRFESFTARNENKELLIGGRVYTQGTSYSTLLCVDADLNPLWIKTYFENSTIQSISSIGRDTFMLIHSSAEGSDLIVDNLSSSIYKKYNLSNDQLFFGSQSIITADKLLLTGVHDSVGRIIQVDLSTQSAFVNDIEIYPASSLKAVFLSRNQAVIAGLQTDGGNEVQFSSELFNTGSQWCHRYPNENFTSILDIIEMPGKGILISAIVEKNGQYFLHLTRIDEEGATFINEYSENCL